MFSHPPRFDYAKFRARLEIRGNPSLLHGIAGPQRLTRLRSCRFHTPAGEAQRGRIMNRLSSVKRFLVSEDGATMAERVVMVSCIIILFLTALQAAGRSAS